MVVTGDLLQQWTHQAEVQKVLLSEDGRLAFTSSKYDAASLWNAETGKKLGDLPIRRSLWLRGFNFTAIAFSHDNSQLLTGNSDRIVALWDIKSQTLSKEWRLPKRDKFKPTSASVLAVAFDKKQYRAVASNGFSYTLQ